MSPRRRVAPGGTDTLRMPADAARRWLPALLAAVTSAAVIAAVAVSALLFVHGRNDERAAIRNAAVVDFVRSFVTQYTSPDPFNANAYADRILARGTGNFAELYREKMNDVVIQVARAEPGVGTVQEVGVQRWNDDGSASVVAVGFMTTTMPDGSKLQSASRWVVQTIQVGEQWKVSDLIQVP